MLVVIMREVRPLFHGCLGLAFKGHLFSWVFLLLLILLLPFDLRFWENQSGQGLAILSCKKSLYSMLGALVLIPHFYIAYIVNVIFLMNEGLNLPNIKVLLLGINNLLGKHLEGLSPDGLGLRTPSQNLRGIVSSPKG